MSHSKKIRVLLVFKRSHIEQSRRDPRTLSGVPAAERLRLERADRANRETLRTVRGELDRRGIHVDPTDRIALPLGGKYDLVLSVGGDGTFFHASHIVGTVPLLGINSDPAHSLGLHCGADGKNFPEILGRFLAGKAPIVSLARLRLAIDGTPLPYPVANDLLFASKGPAEMARYTLRVAGKQETQRSSGIWIANAAGSTAAIYAAGGKRMSLASRKIQYLVREPYTWPARPRLLKGIVDRSLTVRSLIPRGTLWIDGAHHSIDLPAGSVLSVRTGAPPLQVVNLDREKRRRLFP